MFTGFNLATERDFEFHVHVFIGGKVNRYEVTVASVGDGVVPSRVLGVVFGVLFNVPWVDNLPCG